MRRLLPIVLLSLFASSSVAARDFRGSPGHLKNPEILVQVRGCPVKFDEYGNLKLSDEKARLDNFAIQLMNNEKMHGYIVVYAGRKAMVAEAQIRANRARDYIINVRKIAPERVKTIDAGHKEQFQVDLWIWPAGVDPPPFESTVDKSEVEIIHEKKKRTPGRRP
ncbi:MAG TPA: hypothetical protein VJR02_21440 [Pyrinomonadaceae bacterium]|nr:hypothetical protein [Pyrinomonadaceae bacterium]